MNNPHPLPWSVKNQSYPLADTGDYYNYETILDATGKEVASRQDGDDATFEMIAAVLNGAPGNQIPAWPKDAFVWKETKDTERLRLCRLEQEYWCRLPHVDVLMSVNKGISHAYVQGFGVMGESFRVPCHQPDAVDAVKRLCEESARKILLPPPGTPTAAAQLPSLPQAVLGFRFDPARDKMLMIWKARPNWQAGLLNGLGGRVEEGETPEAAMVREFKEESGIITQPEEWKKFCVMQQLGGTDFAHRPGQKGWLVHVFTSQGPIPENACNSDESEPLEQIDADLGALSSVMVERAVDSCAWLVPMAMDFLCDGRPGFALINYPAQ